MDATPQDRNSCRLKWRLFFVFVCTNYLLPYATVNLIGNNENLALDRPLNDRPILLDGAVYAERTLRVCEQNGAHSFALKA